MGLMKYKFVKVCHIEFLQNLRKGLWDTWEILFAAFCTLGHVQKARVSASFCVGRGFELPSNIRVYYCLYRWNLETLVIRRRQT
jgi:hypothetical protein